MWDLGNKMQLCIQGYNKRPYGVGVLVAGHDDLGPHIYQVFLKTRVQHLQAIQATKNMISTIMYQNSGVCISLVFRFARQLISMTARLWQLEPALSLHAHT